MKYIVEVEDDPCMYEDEVHFYKCIQAPWWGLSERVIKQLTPYQPDHTADVSKKVERTDETAQNVSDSDLVSRKATIDALAKFVPYAICDESTESYANGLTDAYNLILQLPSAQPEQRWIPCSERLPEEDTEVLISYRYKEGEGDTDHVNIDITSYGTTCFGGREIHTLKEWRQPFDYFHANYEVIAWMPLPTPYREE